MPSSRAFGLVHKRRRHDGNLIRGARFVTRVTSSSTVSKHKTTPGENQSCFRAEVLSSPPLPQTLLQLRPHSPQRPGPSIRVPLRRHRKPASLSSSQSTPPGVRPCKAQKPILSEL